MRGKVTFETNIWQELALEDPAGFDGENNYGPYSRFNTVGGDTLFLPRPAAAELRALGLRAGEVFKAREAEIRNGGGRPSKVHQFSRLSEAPHGELVFPKGPAAPGPKPEAASVTTVPTVATQPASTANGTTASKPLPESPHEHSGQALLLTQTTNMLVDVLARCKSYAKRYNGDIGLDDVRTLMLSAFINMSKKPEGGRQ